MTDVLRHSENENAVTDDIEAVRASLIRNNFYDSASCKPSKGNDAQDFVSGKEREQQQKRRTDQSDHKDDRKENGDSRRQPSISTDERTDQGESEVQDRLKRRSKCCSVEDVCVNVTDTIMQTGKIFTEMCKLDQPGNAVTSDGSDRNKEARQSSVPEAKQEVINELNPIASQGATNSVSSGNLMTGAKGSSELTPRISRIEGVRQDARRLKSATLGRMGKMFKGRPPTPVTEKSVQDVGGAENISGSDGYGERGPSRKEKTNSLGRMFKLVDKDGAPKKLFIHPRAGSLSRILRRHSNNEESEVISKTTEDSSRGIFSRMLSQFRGK